MSIKVKPETKYCEDCKNNTDHFSFFSGLKNAKVSICKNCSTETQIGKIEKIPMIKNRVDVK